MSPPKKILLLVNSNPTNAGVGELFLRQIVENHKTSEFLRFSFVQNRPFKDEATWLGSRSIERHVPSSSVPILSTALRWMFERKLQSSLSREIAALIDREKIDLIWVVLCSGPIIATADKILDLVSIPMISTVWDDPEYFEKNQHIDRLTRLHTRRQFSNVLRRSKNISVMGRYMREQYNEEYGVTSTILRHGIGELSAVPHKRRGTKEKINIGFAGSLYAKREWNSLLDAIDLGGGKIDGLPVMVTFIGRFPRFGAKKRAYVRETGVLPFDKALEQIKDFDVAYLPYWFDEQHALIAKTSFPGKLSAYAAAGTPILFHGPKYASVTPFLAEYPIGLTCDSLRSLDIINSLRSIISSRAFVENYELARVRAMSEELGKDSMLRSFRSFINVLDGNGAA